MGFPPAPGVGRAGSLQSLGLSPGLGRLTESPVGCRLPAGRLDPKSSPEEPEYDLPISSLKLSYKYVAPCTGPRE